MKALPGIVAPITTGSRVPDATTLARQARIAEAAEAYVAALREWESREGFNEHRRKELHRAQRELVEAVESQR